VHQRPGTRSPWLHGIFGPFIAAFLSTAPQAAPRRPGHRDQRRFQQILLEWLDNPHLFQHAGALSLQLVQENLGASERIARRILAQVK